jgi:DHA1 family bicyclomycin/chloramphenicol resistance-like MFS transporter
LTSPSVLTATIVDPARSIGFIAALGAAFVIGPLSLAIFIPALPAIQQAFHADVQIVQLSLSLPLLAVIVTMPLAGGLSDGIGRRPVAVAGVAVLLAGCVMCVAATSLWVLILGRIIVGTSGTCLLVLARAIVCDAYRGDDLMRAMARYSVAPVVAILAAPPLGGVLIEGFGWRSVFVVLAVLSAAIGGLIYWLPETRSWRRDGASPTAGPQDGHRQRLLRSPVFWGYAWQTAFQFAIAVGFVAAAPYLMVNLLGQSAAAYGLGLLLVVGGMLLGVLVAERLPRRVEIRHQVVTGCVVGLAGSALTPLLLGPGGFSLSPAILFGPTIFAAFGLGLAVPASQAGFVGAVPEAAGLASGIATGLKMIAAAALIHLTALPWSRPGLALGWIGLLTMLLALASVLPMVVPKWRLGQLRDHGATETSAPLSDTLVHRR